MTQRREKIEQCREKINAEQLVSMHALRPRGRQLGVERAKDEICNDETDLDSIELLLATIPLVRQSNNARGSLANRDLLAHAVLLQ